MGELVEEPGLPDARLADDRDHLAVAVASELKGTPKLLQLGFPPNESGETTSGRYLESRPHRPRTYDLVHFDRFAQTLEVHRTEWLDLDIALGQPEGSRR
jgi:hypothetical protein